MEPAAPVTRTTLPWSAPRICVFFQAHGVAAEEIFDGYVADLRGQSVAFDDFGEAGNGFVGNAGLVATVQDGCHLRAGGGRQRDENHLDGLRRDDGGQIRAGAEDLHTMNEAAGLGRIVVDEAYDFVRQRRILVDLAEQTDSGVTGAVDQSPFLPHAVRQRPEEFDCQPHAQADARSHHETQQEIQEIDRARKPLRGEQQESDAAEGGAGEVGNSEARDIANGSISPPAAVQLEQMEDEDLRRHKDAGIPPASAHGIAAGTVKSNRRMNARTPATANMAN